MLFKLTSNRNMNFWKEYKLVQFALLKKCISTVVQVDISHRHTPLHLT